MGCLCNHWCPLRVRGGSASRIEWASAKASWRSRPNRESLAANASREPSDSHWKWSIAPDSYREAFSIFSTRSARRRHFPAARGSAPAGPKGIRIPGLRPRMALRPRSTGRPEAGRGSWRRARPLRPHAGAGTRWRHGGPQPHYRGTEPGVACRTFAAPLKLPMWI